MKHKGAWFGLAVSAVIVTGIVVDPTQVVVGKLAADAFFQGRPTRYWMRALRGDPAQQAAAQSALEQGGRDAVPVLVDILTGSPSRDAATRCAAVDLLVKLGPDAANAASAVAAGVNDRDSHVQALCATALSKLEVPADTAVPLLRHLLKTTNVVVAERELSRYRGAAAPAVPDLVALVNDKRQSTEVRWNAARTIAKIGAGAIDGLDALIAALADEDWLIREHSAEAIGELGDMAAAKGIPTLRPLLSDPVARVRRDTVRSLGHFGESAGEAVPEIKKLLEDEDENVRKAATTALKAIAPDTENGQRTTDEPSAPK